jgi:hypothetical protein
MFSLWSSSSLLTLSQQLPYYDRVSIICHWRRQVHEIKNYNQSDEHTHVRCAVASLLGVPSSLTLRNADIPQRSLDFL